MQFCVIVTGCLFFVLNVREVRITGEETLTLRDYVKMQIDSGIPPLELRYAPITRCATNTVMAFRTETLIHSMLLGEMNEEFYTPVSDRSNLVDEMLFHNMQHAVSTCLKFQASDKRVAFVSVRAPATLCDNTDLYELVAHLLSKNPQFLPSMLCLEFPASVVAKDTKKACEAILGTRLLGMRTAITGCGTSEFPVEKLSTLSPDMVFLDPEMTHWAGNRNKPQMFAAFVAYLRSMELDVYAVANSEQRDALRRAECTGFLPLRPQYISENEAFGLAEVG